MSKIKAVVFDIDGTLADREGGSDRGIHDYHRVAEDAVHEDILELAYLYYNAGYKILIVTGRPERSKKDGFLSCKEITEAWLYHVGVPYHDIFMREEGNFESDATLKPRLYRQFIEDTYDVRVWVDDRKRVVDAIRSIGIRVLQVAPGEF